MPRLYISFRRENPRTRTSIESTVLADISQCGIVLVHCTMQRLVAYEEEASNTVESGEN